MINKHDTGFLFSVIVPVYNVEDYLADTLQSLEDQVGGYFERTEVIIVDDGSPDDSYRIAEQFHLRYPNNVVLIRQENAGVSAAKNAGIDRATGEYLGFLDSDDMYERNVLKVVAQFFDTLSESDSDVVSIPMRFFGARTGGHRLNRKFNGGDRVIDVSMEWRDVQLSSASTFVRKSCIDALNLRFDPAVMLGEDAKFITEAIMRLRRFAVVSGAHYEYRKRHEGGSAIDGFMHNPKSYLPVVVNAWEYLFDNQERDGIVPRYVQNVACHDMEWRLKQVEQHALSETEFAGYMEHVTGLLKRIDDDVILAQPFFGEVHKLYALRLKHDMALEESGHYQGKAFYFNHRKLWATTRRSFKFEVDSLKYSNKRLRVHGRLTGIAAYGLVPGVFLNGCFRPATREVTPDYQKIFNNGTIVFEPMIISFDIPVEIGDRVSFGVCVDGEYIDEIGLQFMNASRMPSFPKSYRVFENVIVANAGGLALYIQDASLKNHVKRELLHLRKTFWATFRGKTLSKSVPLYRFAAILGKKLKRKQIWIISDRPYAAGDNGEAFFRYIETNKPKGVRTYFNIKESSPDYERISRIGRVIDQESRWGKLLFLLSDEIVSSQADEVVINAFGSERRGVMDLYEFNFRFLQHGVTVHDLSGWLNKGFKDIKTFVTASPHEQLSILNGGYGYSEAEVPLTGFPRFDQLENRAERKIIVAPTWRMTLAGQVDPETGLREYSQSFSESSYFAFFESLIKDERLNKALDEADYVAELYLHPNHFANVSDFSSTERFTVSHPPHNYQHMFATASVLVTDYSSVFFDFAYLRKPLLYVQFDKEEFYETQAYQEGYFDYERDGFGPVCFSYEEAVDQLISILKSGAKIDPKYSKRIEHFFAFDDRDNSKRVLEHIVGDSKCGGMP